MQKTHEYTKLVELKNLYDQNLKEFIENIQLPESARKDSLNNLSTKVANFFYDLETYAKELNDKYKFNYNFIPVYGRDRLILNIEIDLLNSIELEAEKLKGEGEPK